MTAWGLKYPAAVAMPTVVNFVQVQNARIDQEG